METSDTFIHPAARAQKTLAGLEDIVSHGEKGIAEGNFQPVAIDDL